MRQVDGWDRAVLLWPYGTPSDFASEAAGSNPWLHLRLRSMPLMDMEEWNRMLVIDDGHLIAVLDVDWVPLQGVVRRDP